MSPPKRVSPLLPLATARWRRAVFLKIRIGVSRALFRGWLTLRRHRLCLYFQGLLRLTSSGASRPGACVCTDGEDNFCRRDQYQPALLRRRRDRSPGDEPKRRGQHRRRRKVRGVAEGFLRVTFCFVFAPGTLPVTKTAENFGKNWARWEEALLPGRLRYSAFWGNRVLFTIPISKPPIRKNYILANKKKELQYKSWKKNKTSLPILGSEPQSLLSLYQIFH